MAKSTQPGRSSELKDSASASARRATTAAGRARREARAETPATPNRQHAPEPASEAAPALFEPSPAVPPTLDRARALSAESALAEPTTAPLERALGAPITGQPAPAESEVGEPTMAPSAAATAAAPEPPPALVPTVDEPPAPAAVPTGLPEPVVASPGLALTTAGMSWPGSGLVEGGVRIRSEMIAFIWRETEHGLALGRELLASRSLPEILTLQTAYLGETLERTVAQGLEVARLSTDLLRAGGRSTRAD